jgi:hypothetical protein
MQHGKIGKINKNWDEFMKKKKKSWIFLF